MEDVVNFLEKFFGAEVQALLARRLPDLESFNSKLEEMNSFVATPLHNTFGMIPLHQLEDGEFYEDMRNASPPQKRFLFRIDKIINEENEIIYRCFVSDPNPLGKYYADCFIIKFVDSKLEIVSSYFFGNPKGGNKDWNIGAGTDVSMDFNNLGTIDTINRLLAPKDEPESMREYEKDV